MSTAGGTTSIVGRLVHQPPSRIREAAGWLLSVGLIYRSTATKKARLLLNVFVHSPSLIESLEQPRMFHAQDWMSQAVVVERPS